jgi:putative transcriptional regulator
MQPRGPAPVDSGRKPAPLRFDAGGTGLAGKLLIASPGLDDDTFERTVILLCLHDAEHAMGVVLNRAHEGVMLGEVLRQMGLEPPRTLDERPVLSGGPVAPERGLVLHTPDFFTVENTLEVCPGVCLTATRNALEVLTGEEAPQAAWLALGYAGWGAGQLENEISDSVWVLANPSPEIVFGPNLAAKWERALGSAGLSAARFSAASGQA